MFCLNLQQMILYLFAFLFFDVFAYEKIFLEFGKEAQISSNKRHDFRHPRHYIRIPNAINKTKTIKKETVHLKMVLKKLILSIPFCCGINYFFINTLLLYIHLK